MTRLMHRTMLHIFPTFALGGSQARFAQIARGVGGWCHVIASLDGDRAADAAMGNAKRRYEDIALRPSFGFDAVNLGALKAAFLRVAPDLICTYNWGSIEAVIANRLMANGLRPRFPHLHFEDGFGPEESSGELRRRRLTRRAVLGAGGPHVAVPSSFLESAAKTGWGVAAKRLHRVSNGVDLSRFVPGTHQDDRVVYLGALRPEKNVARLIRAANATGTNLHIWGTGLESAALQSLAGPTISFRGVTDRPEDVLRGARALALSSDTEQMPLTVLEAMASGLPVLSTDVGDVARMVCDENQPFVTPLGDDGAYTEALRTLMNEPSRAAAIGSSNRRMAETRFGLDAMISRYSALFDDIAGTA